jgi:uncharacterized membrane protein YdjX (TVP38/TMEM64 family)
VPVGLIYAHMRMRQSFVQQHGLRVAVATILASILTAVATDQGVRGCCVSATTTNASQPVPLACVERQACLNLGFQLLTKWIADETLIGSLVLTFVLAISALALIPAAALTIGAGAAFAQALGVGRGVLVGSLVVFIGLSIGALLAFLLARYLLRDMVQRQLQKWRITAAIDAALATDGLRVMVLLRLSPLVPYNVFNYLIAATSVSFRAYSAALFAMIPATFGYVYLGATVAEAASAAMAGAESTNAGSEAQTIRILSLSIGAACTVLAVAAISVVAKRHLNHLSDGEAQQQQQQQQHEMAPIPARLADGAERHPACASATAAS